MGKTRENRKKWIIKEIIVPFALLTSLLVWTFFVQQPVDTWRHIVPLFFLLEAFVLLCSVGMGVWRRKAKYKNLKQAAKEAWRRWEKENRLQSEIEEKNRIHEYWFYESYFKGIASSGRGIYFYEDIHRLVRLEDYLILMMEWYGKETYGIALSLHHMEKTEGFCAFLDSVCGKPVEYGSYEGIG